MGGKVEIVTDSIFLGFKITVDSDCSHEIKRCLLLGRKAMANLDRILKSRDITLPTKVHIIKAVIFPVVMYTCKSWTIEKAECQKNWCFRVVVLEKTLESRLDCKEIKPVNPKGNQPWIVIGRTDAEAEAPILWPPDAKSWLIAKHPDAGKDWRKRGDNRGWGVWVESPTQQTWIWANAGSYWRTGEPGVLQSVGVTKSQTQLSNWTTTATCFITYVCRTILNLSEINFSISETELWMKELERCFIRYLAYNKFSI